MYDYENTFWLFVYMYIRYFRCPHFLCEQADLERFFNLTLS